MCRVNGETVSSVWCENIPLYRLMCTLPIGLFCTFSDLLFILYSQKKLYFVVSPNVITDIFTLRHFRNKMATLQGIIVSRSRDVATMTWQSKRQTNRFRVKAWKPYDMVLNGYNRVDLKPRSCKLSRSLTIKLPCTCVINLGPFLNRSLQNKNVKGPNSGTSREREPHSHMIFQFFLFVIKAASQNYSILR